MEGPTAILIFVSVMLGSGFVYLMFMIFLPEWVGITGKKALDMQKDHIETDRGIEAAPAEPSVDSSVDKDHR